MIIDHTRDDDTNSEFGTNGTIPIYFVWWAVSLFLYFLALHFSLFSNHLLFALTYLIVALLLSVTPQLSCL